MTAMKSLGLAAAVAIGFAAGAEALEMKELNFGIISTESTQNLKSQWEPFIADMEKKLGTKVNAFFAPDYAGIIQAMRFGKVQVAWYGNKAAIEAVDRADGEVFVQTVAADGSPGYWSLILAHKDSKLASFEPAKSAGAFERDKFKPCQPCMDELLNNAGAYTFGNGDPNSTSGFAVPGYYVFAQANLDPKQAFKRMVSANHETNALAVANRQVDAATNNTENLDRIRINQPQKYADLRAIWMSPLIPSDPIVWRKDVSPADKQAIKAFFLDYGVKGAEVEAEKKVLAGLQWAPFRDSSNKQLIPIRQLDLFKAKLKLEADDQMAAAEKKQKLAEVQAQLDALQKELATN